MPATTTSTEFLANCPACKKSISADVTYEVKLDPPRYAEGEIPDAIEKTATATLTVVGVNVSHRCPGTFREGRG